MSRMVRGGLIQASLNASVDDANDVIKRNMIDKHLKMIDEAAEKGAQVICLQELFYGPYFCAEQNTRWYDLTEKNSRWRNHRADAGSGQKTRHRAGGPHL